MVKLVNESVCFPRYHYAIAASNLNFNRFERFLFASVNVFL